MPDHVVRTKHLGLFRIRYLEEEMATHCSVLAWRVPWTEEPGGLQSMESQSRTRLSDVTHSTLDISWF